MFGRELLKEHLCETFIKISAVTMKNKKCIQKKWMPPPEKPIRKLILPDVDGDGWTGGNICNESVPIISLWKL